MFMGRFVLVFIWNIMAGCLLYLWFRLIWLGWRLIWLGWRLWPLLRLWLDHSDWTLGIPIVVQNKPVRYTAAARTCHPLATIAVLSPAEATLQSTISPSVKLCILTTISYTVVRAALQAARR